MATADSVKTKLSNLISRANSTTGKSDATLTNAVNNLIAGYNKGGTTPSGSLSITSNGTFNVTNYASAVVNVPIPEPVAVVRTVTVSSDVVGAKDYVLLSNDEFIKKHYADNGFSATLIAASPAASAANVVHFSYQGNRNVGSSNVARYGIGLRSTSTSVVGTANLTAKISAEGWGQHMRVNSSGKLSQYLHTDYVLKAGTYIIVLACTD